ncbi:HmuY family protein [Flavihumibacter sp. CACIAM 22H1]|uniref:HmuY family protein n=1 Tax=Flavihumibacter sp. CACIAM 22H1 TaxID=1812911 RepID=UPI0007A7F287|nr:HmuY family protein [Flavihumibacter sp. CACIAM 22H1]KYP13297.1 MAG: hypothetical protein A1D16_06575 [Flavihumibacter sp. CACIAM 22H1]
MQQQAGSVVWFISALLVLNSCTRKEESLPVIPPSAGARLQLNGGAGGAAAINTVFLDLSTAKQDSVKRTAWDLALYTGNDFSVMINNTTVALAKATTKSNLADVSAADTAGMVLALNHAAPSATEFALLDDIGGDLSKTVIGTISATESANKVYILNRGTGGGVAARDWLKIKIIRKGNGYSIQYAKIAEANFSTIDVVKNNSYQFNYISFDNGPVTVEPEKENWDLQWGYAVFKTNFGGGDVPYAFSDLIAINFRAGVQVAEILTSTTSYENFKEADLATASFSADRWAIGSNWRATTGAAIGVKTDRFYLVKDSNGNYYKLKFISFTSQDGGTRGKPELSFQLVKEA